MEAMEVGGSHRRAFSYHWLWCHGVAAWDGKRVGGRGWDSVDLQEVVQGTRMEEGEPRVSMEEDRAQGRPGRSRARGESVG